MKCRINKGAEQVFAPNQNESILFAKIYSIVGDFQSALDTYAISETEGFKAYNDVVSDKSKYDLNGEPDLQTFMNYVNSLGESTATREDVINFMQSAGVFDSEDLLVGLSRIEKEGVPIFTTKSLQDSGIFSNFEAELISRDKSQQDQVLEVLKWLRQNPDIILSERAYETDGEQLPSGKNQVEVETTEENLIEVGFKRPDTKYTISPFYSESLSEDISFLTTGITDVTWDRNLSQVSEVLQNIEDKALDNGLNVKGLSEQAVRREDVLDFLSAIEDVLTEEITTEQFDVIRQEFFEDGFREESRVINEDTDVIIKDNLTEDQAYEQGLLKIAEDVYRRIPEIDYDTLLLTQADNEGLTVEEMDAEVNRNYDRGLDNGKIIYLLKRNQDIVTQTERNDVTGLDNFTGDYEYLTNEFVTEFAKVADEDFFDIDFKGITFKPSIDKNQALSTLDSETLYNLEQYSLISPYISMPYQVEGLNLNVENIIDRQKALTDPASVKEYRDNVTFVGEDLIVIKDSLTQFVRFNGQLYELTEQDYNNSFYKPVIDFNKPVSEINVFDYTSLRLTPKEPTQHRLQNTKRIKEEYFNC